MRAANEVPKPRSQVEARSRPPVESAPPPLEQISTRPLIAAFCGNGVIAVSKFLAAATTGSAGMTAEGLHSIVDAVNNLLMLFGIRSSRRAPTPEHPFGHGKELYFWSLIVAVVIFGVGGGVSIYGGAARMIHPAELGPPQWNYLVLLVAFIAESATFVIAYRELRPYLGRRGLWRGIRASKDPTKFAVVLEDGAATVGILFAASGVWLSETTGNARFDAAASILVGLLLAGVAIVLAGESKDLLLGESARPATVRAIRATVEEDKDVVAVRNLLTMHLGPSELLLNLDVQFRRDLVFPEVARAIERLEARIRERHPGVSQIFIEARVFGSFAPPE